ncbi:MAG: protein-export chaperone SecB [Succinivibrio sp.]|nr:protein-export chaperone SecB [Succinivibrio sp.]
MSEAEKNQNTNEIPNDQPFFDIIRIYAKDCSLETPCTPKVFLQPLKPSVNIEFDTKTQPIADDQYEVDLRVTATCKSELDGKEEVVYICEVHQAGAFIIKNMDEESMEYLLAGLAPNILFPYAREHISALVNRATFPALNLRPINFEALYRARKAEEMQQGEEANKDKDAPQA